MAELKEIRELYKGLQGEFDLMYKEKDSVLDECFVLSCSGFGLERYEKMLGITALSGDSVEDRRLRILAALNGETPYTFEAVYNKLVLLCGEGNVFMEYAQDSYTLRVMLQLDAKNKYDTVIKMLREMLPCNIALICLLAYNRHSTLGGFTHSTLSGYTHRELIDEVIG
jgi:hypothetical protein